MGFGVWGLDPGSRVKGSPARRGGNALDGPVRRITVRAIRYLFAGLNNGLESRSAPVHPTKCTQDVRVVIQIMGAPRASHHFVDGLWFGQCKREMSGALSSRQCKAQQSRVRDDIQVYRQPARSYPECAWRAHARGTVAAMLMCDGAVKTDF